MNPEPPIGRLHVLTDFLFQQRLGHAALAGLAIAGGADTIQFRQKHGAIRHKLSEAVRTAETCARAGVLFLVNDQVELALAAGAGGVHLGQEDLPIPFARRILGADRTIGATVTTVEQARRARDEGADYLGFGPVYLTRSKANPVSVKGLDGLADVCASVPLPVIAIAGITVERTRAVLEAGSYGIAVMTAVSTEPDPRAATARFRAEIDGWLAGRG